MTTLEQLVELKFKSGNDISVDQITIRREELEGLSNGWISVDTELPRSGRNVLIAGGIGYYSANQKMWYTIHEQDVYGHNLPIQWEIVEWMPQPIPTPPINKEGK